MRLRLQLVKGLYNLSTMTPRNYLNILQIIISRCVSMVAFFFSVKKQSLHANNRKLVRFMATLGLW